MPRAKSKPAGPSAIIEAIDLRLLADPISFLFAEHYRQRAVLAHLDSLSADVGMASRAVAEAVLDYLKTELPRHIADEENDLFPAMRRRCTAEDNIEALIDGLTAEHGDDESLAATVIEGLTERLQDTGWGINVDLNSAVRAFAETQRRHLAWENALVLPLARKRLSTEDLARISRSMATRRSR
ncbi:MAG: hemerythrin domain-containing protein, partial [Rhodospirillales bacterium]|nr:hemerythrin domain-containing protein [Rhodospirillales bacterium]